VIYKSPTGLQYIKEDHGTNQHPPVVLLKSIWEALGKHKDSKAAYKAYLADKKASTKGETK